MQTEEKVEEMIKEERKKVFWRLYALPWVLLTLTLIGIIIYLYKAPSIVKTENRAFISDTNTNVNTNVNTNGNGISYKEAVNRGVGEWICDTNGEVSFKWKASTESVISSQVNVQVQLKLKNLQEQYKTNAIEVLENKRKETIIECRRDFQMEAIGKGLGKWVCNNNGEVEFKWKVIPEIVMEYTCTESNELNKINQVKRDMPFTMKDFEMAKVIGIDIEKELIKRSMLGIEAAYWGNKDNITKEIVKGEVSRAIHGMFDGFETLNKTDKQEKEWRIK